MSLLRAKRRHLQKPGHKRGEFSVAFVECLRSPFCLPRGGVARLAAFVHKNGAMKLGSSRLGGLTRVWIVPACVGVLVLIGAVTAIALSVSAQNAAAERAALQAEAEAAAEAARAAATARLASARQDAVETAAEAESLYADSEVWGPQEAREDLRRTLDVLVALDASTATADELESATRDLSTAISRVGSPPAPITVVCGNLDAGISFEPRELVLNPDGSGQFDELWAGQYRCDEGMSSDSVRASVKVQTSLQLAAVAAGRAAGKGEYFNSDEEILYAIYEMCVGSGSGAYYSDLATLSEDQARDTQVTLTLCPNHPDAETWRSKSAAGDGLRAAEANGTRIPPGGSYLIPSEMSRGTFAAENVTDCYWETRDANGEIVDNNFVLAAPRVVAEVGDVAVVFTTQGGCGYWNRQ